MDKITHSQLLQDNKIYAALQHAAYRVLRITDRTERIGEDKPSLLERRAHGGIDAVVEKQIAQCPRLRLQLHCRRLRQPVQGKTGYTVAGLTIGVVSHVIGRIVHERRNGAPFMEQADIDRIGLAALGINQRAVNRVKNKHILTTARWQQGLTWCLLFAIEQRILYRQMRAEGCDEDILRYFINGGFSGPLALQVFITRRVILAAVLTLIGHLPLQTPRHQADLPGRQCRCVQKILYINGHAKPPKLCFIQAMTKPKAYHVVFTTDTTKAQAYAEALETFCPTVSWIDTDEDGIVEVEGISETPFDDKAVKAALQKAVKGKLPPVTIEPLPDKDWLLLSFQSFPPKPLGRFWIYGSHETTKPPKGSWPLMIDAATAFGSGEHPTTAGCLLAIEKLSKKKPYANVLDMGTGSGILAIAAARAMQSKVTAIDIDPESIRVTGNHGKANKLSKYLKLAAGPGYDTPLAKKNAPYDLILCNILANPLKEMAPQAAGVIKKGGRIVLAGLLNKQARGVISAYEKQGFVLEEKVKREEWSILTLKFAGNKAGKKK